MIIRLGECTTKLTWICSSFSSEGFQSIKHIKNKVKITRDHKTLWFMICCALWDFWLRRVLGKHCFSHFTILQFIAAFSAHKFIGQSFPRTWSSFHTVLDCNHLRKVLVYSFSFLIYYNTSHSQSIPWESLFRLDNSENTGYLIFQYADNDKSYVNSLLDLLSIFLQNEVWNSLHVYSASIFYYSNVLDSPSTYLYLSYLH